MKLKVENYGESPFPRSRRQLDKRIASDARKDSDAIFVFIIKFNVNL